MSGSIGRDAPADTKPARKQWKVFDGPKSSLHRLRSELARDGDLTSQVSLAKQLIGEVEDLRRFCEDSSDGPGVGLPSAYETESSKETAELGVYWLLRAAEQGHAEATELLQKCLDTGLGITQHNYVDITACLQKPLLHRIANRAAIELFRNVARGEEYVTTNQLKVRIKSVQARKKLREYKRSESLDTNPDPNSLEEEFGGEKLSEDHIRSAASSYARGELPLFQSALSTTIKERWTVDKAYSYLLEEFSTRANKLVLNLLPFDQLKIILILVVFGTMRWDLIANLIPIFIFYVSLVIAVGANCQMLQASADFKRFKVWSRLFRDACPDLETSEPEIRFVANRARDTAPRFFAALLISVAVRPLVDPAWIPSSELVYVGAIFSTWSFFAMGKPTDSSTLAATFLHLLALYLAGETAFEQRPVDVLSFFGSYFYRLRLTSEVYINLQLPHGLLITSMALIYVSMCFKNNGAGLYTTLVPHLVSVAWLRFAVSAFADATSVGLLRSAITIVGLVFLIPMSWLNLSVLFILVALGLGSLPFFALTKFIVAEELLLESTLVLGLCFILGILHWAQQDGSLAFSKSRAILKGFVCLLAGLMLFQTARSFAFRYWGEEAWKPGEKVSIGWDGFSRICIDPARNGISTYARTQKECLLLEGCLVDWTGEIQQVSISEVDNSIKHAVDRLPESLANFFYCFYGQPIPQRPGDQLLPGEDAWDFENLMDFKNRQCHLSEYDSYSFEFIVKMPTAGYWNAGLNVVLEAGNEFQSFAFNASKGDVIAFSAVLKSGIGTESLVLNLREIRCIQCREELPVVVYEPPVSVWDEFVVGVKSVLKFVFAPFVAEYPVQ